MKSFLGITLILLLSAGSIHLVLIKTSNLEAIFPMWLASILCYSILMPTYLLSILAKRTSESLATKIFYGGFLFRFIAIFALIVAWQGFLKLPSKPFVPFVLFFYLLLLFLEAGILSYKFSTDDQTIV